MITSDYIQNEIQEILSKDSLTACDLKILHDLFSVQKYIGKLMQKTGELTSEMAIDWVAHMENSDGSFGEHWTIQETTAVRDKLGYKSIPECEFYAVMNSIYSDYGETLSKANVNSADTYGQLAIDWIEDDDAVKAKASSYYTFVVDHD